MTDKYDYPLPILSADTDSLSIETKDSHRGHIEIKNTGGGVLRGAVLSRCRGLSFEPAEFEGNSQKISFTFNAQAAGLGIGESVSSRFFITSNGGEKEIPVTAKLTKMSISTPDGHTIANIRDFYEYSLTHPTQARRLFTDSEFYMLLLAGGYEYIEVYESLHKDANRERAMDNFFILSGLKARTQILVVNENAPPPIEIEDSEFDGTGKSRLQAMKYREVESRAREKNSPLRLEFSQNPNISDMLAGEFKVRKSDTGYVEMPMLLRENAPWLSLSSGKLTTFDFDEENTATVGFHIDPKKIKNNFAREQILVGDCTVEVVYRRMPPLILRLNRDTYRYADRGAIEVVNNTGVNMQISVFCPENFVRFTAKSFPIGARGEIPFEIKLSTFMNAQMLFRKLPYLNTQIEIKAKIPAREFKKVVPLTVGEW